MKKYRTFHLKKVREPRTCAYISMLLIRTRFTIKLTVYMFSIISENIVFLTIIMLNVLHFFSSKQTKQKSEQGFLLSVEAKNCKQNMRKDAKDNYIFSHSLLFKAKYI